MSDADYASEMLDLVNINDEVVGTISHEAAFDLPRDGGQYLRASHVLIVNKDGKIWIPRRVATKRIKPNGLDFSAAEHVEAGEAYLAAIVRGCQEELNLTVAPDQFVELSKTFPEPGEVPYITMDYLLFSDDDPDYSRDDFVSAEWLEPSELLVRLQNGEVAKENLANSVRLLINYQSI